MSANQYHLVTHWHVEGTIEELSIILRDAASFPKWWKQVYLDARIVRPGNERGIGKVAEVRTRGFLPYILNWRVTVVESNGSHGFAVEASGDFSGRGVWTLKQSDAHVEAIFDWSVRVNKPLLRRLSFLLKPIFAANHRWAMGRGEEAVVDELLRRRASARLRPRLVLPATV